MNRTERTITIILTGILLLLTAAYIYGVGTQFEEMLARPVRISYFAADLLVLFPLAIATIAGMMRQRAWRYRMLWLTLGVLLFDMAHQMIYLFRDNYFEVHLAVPVVLFLLIVAFTLYALTSIDTSTITRENG